MLDFFDIPMEGIAEPHELDNYLAQAIEKVRDPVAWWWDHRHVFPTLSKMAFDYLSIPGMHPHNIMGAVLTLFQQHQQLSSVSSLRADN